jgi:hypothetical protein
MRRPRCISRKLPVTLEKNSMKEEAFLLFHMNMKIFNGGDASGGGGVI